MPSTLIIGGGISGLTAAYALGRECTCIDDGPALGGRHPNPRSPGLPHRSGPRFVPRRQARRPQLIGELGLAGDVIGSNDHQRVTFIQRKGRLVAMPDGLMMMIPTKLLPMAFTPLLGWGTKLRMGLEFFHGKPSAPLPDRSVAAFVRELYGQEVVDYLAEPLLAGVLRRRPRAPLRLERPAPHGRPREQVRQPHSRHAHRAPQGPAHAQGATLFRHVEGRPRHSHRRARKGHRPAHPRHPRPR